MQLTFFPCIHPPYLVCITFLLIMTCSDQKLIGGMSRNNLPFYLAILSLWLISYLEILRDMQNVCCILWQVSYNLGCVFRHSLESFMTWETVLTTSIIFSLDIITSNSLFEQRIWFLGMSYSKGETKTKWKPQNHQRKSVLHPFHNFLFIKTHTHLQHLSHNTFKVHLST